jgi:hypothetical protein
MKSIRLSGHALGYCASRGFTAAEVEEAIRRGPWEKAELDRLEARLEFAFDAEWNGHHYATKQVRPVFVEEPNEIVVVTVYTYYC